MLENNHKQFEASKIVRNITLDKFECISDRYIHPIFDIARIRGSVLLATWEFVRVPKNAVTKNVIHDTNLQRHI